LQIHVAVFARAACVALDVCPAQAITWGLAVCGSKDVSDADCRRGAVFVAAALGASVFRVDCIALCPEEASIALVALLSVCVVLAIRADPTLDVSIVLASVGMVVALARNALERGAFCPPVPPWRSVEQRFADVAGVAFSAMLAHATSVVVANQAMAVAILSAVDFQVDDGEFGLAVKRTDDPEPHPLCSQQLKQGFCNATFVVQVFWVLEQRVVRLKGEQAFALFGIVISADCFRDLSNHPSFHVKVAFAFFHEKTKQNKTVIILV